MSRVVCNLCSCRLNWEAVDPDALMCECGHALEDDHVALPAASSPAELDEKPLQGIFIGRKVI